MTIAAARASARPAGPKPRPESAAPAQPRFTPPLPREACACGGSCPRCSRKGARAFAGISVELDSQRALDLGASAFTQGDRIHFAPGQWAPERSAGRALIGHELAHVLQQRQGRVRPSARRAGVALNDDPALEIEADALAATALQFAGDPRDLPRAATPAAAGTAQRRSWPVPQTCAAPATLACTPAVDDPPRVSREFAFAQDSDALSAAQLATLVTVAARWHASGGGTVVRIDGYASAEGDCDYNWALSCRRAAAIKAGLEAPADRSPGIPALQLLALAKGESDSAGDDLARNRRATLYVPPPPLPVSRGPDQRVAPGGAVATVPDADLAREIGFELSPGSRPPPVQPQPPQPQPQGAPPQPVQPPPPPTPWDGRTGSPTEAASRAAMQRELFAAFDAHLRFELPRVTARLALPSVPFATPANPGGGGPAPTGVVDIANQARDVLEARYATSMNAAATTPALLAQRGPLQSSGVGQNLFDPASEADRSALTGDADLAPDVAWWLFENDVPGATDAAGSRRFATDVLAAHHYSSADPGAEDFRWTVAEAYARARTLAPNNRRRLIAFRMAIWSEATQPGGRTGFTVQSRFDPGATPVRSELRQRWQIFETSTHESLHLCTHPVFRAADRGRATMLEGFTEMFAVSTLNGDVLPAVRAGRREPLRRVVEGAASPAAPDATLVANRVTPTHYANHLAQAVRIRDGGTPPGGPRHAGVGEEAVRAAYFQGHVEYLGLDAAGAPLAVLPAAGAARPLRVPPGIADLDDLARRSGVARPTIERDNPGIGAPLPATARLAGCREHRTVSGENRARIAAQNGVSEAALVAANPDVAIDPATNAWPVFPGGRVLLIPVH